MSDSVKVNKKKAICMHGCYGNGCERNLDVGGEVVRQPCQLVRVVFLLHLVQRINDDADALGADSRRRILPK